MAIGASALSGSSSGLTPGQASQSAADVPFGLRGASSLGSGLRTGVTVVERAIETSQQLGEARQQARDARAEQARLEREAAEAEEAARREELKAGAGAAEDPASTSGEQASPQTIEAAVAAGEAGESVPRGAFVDLSI